MTRAMTLHPVHPGVVFVEGYGANWVVLVGDGEVGLIDTGYPADLDSVERSIVAAGGAGLPLTTILVTHGHSDHIGGASALANRHGATVFAAADEVANVRRDIIDQVGIADLAPRLWRPRTAAWAWMAWRSGGLADVAVPAVRALPPGPLTIAGMTIEPIPTPGHTHGHTAYLIRDAAAIATGDALVTAHPLGDGEGPQVLPELFHADPSAVDASLDALAGLSTRLVLPGHGPLLREHAAFAVSAARHRAVRESWWDRGRHPAGAAPLERVPAHHFAGWNTSALR